MKKLEQIGEEYASGKQHTKHTEWNVILWAVLAMLLTWCIAASVGEIIGTLFLQ